MSSSPPTTTTSTNSKDKKPINAFLVNAYFRTSLSISLSLFPSCRCADKSNCMSFHTQVTPIEIEYQLYEPINRLYTKHWRPDDFRFPFDLNSQIKFIFHLINRSIRLQLFNCFRTSFFTSSSSSPLPYVFSIIRLSFPVWHYYVCFIHSSASIEIE